MNRKLGHHLRILMAAPLAFAALDAVASGLKISSSSLRSLSHTCINSPIAIGGTVSGVIDTAHDCALTQGFFYDGYELDALGGSTLVISVDSYYSAGAILVTPSGEVLAAFDTGLIRLSETGRWLLAVASQTHGATYTVTVTCVEEGPFPPCQADTSVLLRERFRLRASWRDFQGRTGVGWPALITADSVNFWFFTPNNIELVVKVLDGRPVNGRFWVFYGALSNVEYTITVTDTQTGRVRTYFNPSGQFASRGDTDAFLP